MPFLWEFHKVHHTATVLTPLTIFRVHPVYMCIFLNILALFTGLAAGVGEYLLGSAHQYGLSENNIILVFFIYLHVPPAALAGLDFIHRMAGPAVHEPGAPSDS
jgi:sterol desaturase/sphingolipid hydroxylase (fatty acid hydroxylase superfamily)